MIATAILRINDILPDEVAILRYLDIKRESLSLRSHNEKSRWYYASYPVILTRYEQTKNLPIQECWIERIAWVYSWIGQIPAGGLDREAMYALSEIESRFAEATLQNIDVESYTGSTFPELQGETLFSSFGEGDPVPIKEFVILADKILQVSGSWSTTLSTSTKLLHFTFPGLFPIYDSNISNLLFGGKTRDYKQYHAYIMAMREFIMTSELMPVIKREAKSEGITEVRLLEMLLFIAGKNVGGSL